MFSMVAFSLGEETLTLTDAAKQGQAGREFGNGGAHWRVRDGAARAYNARVSVPFEIIEHPADVGFMAYGATLEELFANAAVAMMSLACALEGVEERERREVRARGVETESLLYAWLAEILAIADAEQMVFRRAVVTRLSAGEIHGAAFGEKFDRSRHCAGTYIKAVTYHQFLVEKIPDGWRARVFLDV
jgi:protein archease